MPARCNTTGRSDGAKRALTESHFEYADIEIGVSAEFCSVFLDRNQPTIEFLNKFHFGYGGKKKISSNLLISHQLKIEFTTMIHIKIIMAWIIGM